MARRGISSSKMEAAALQAGRRMISRGERPACRLRMAQDRRQTIVEAPWLEVGNRGDRRGVIGAAAAVISAWLDCDPTAFDVEVVD